MDELIEQVVEELSDYRAEEGHKVEADRVVNWVTQFEEHDRDFILTEMINVFKKRYCTRNEGIKFLKDTINFLFEHYKYEDPKSFLAETEFLSLQELGKSQTKFLELLGDVLREDFDYDIEKHNPKKIKNFLYIDDILCTGNTLYQDMFAWLNELENGKKRIENIQKQNQRIIFSYIFMYSKNYHKKVAQMKYNIIANIKDYIQMIRWIEIDNSSNIYSSKCEIIKPIEVELSERAIDYKTEICAAVDDHANGRYQVAEDFFRPNHIPANEKFFTSVENRKRLEKIFLDKGIEILDNTGSVTMQQMRALGYSLPSYKDFGFGALCFTWRNVPNNTPLVFWYAGGGFIPLFEKYTREIDYNAIIASMLNKK